MVNLVVRRNLKMLMFWMNSISCLKLLTGFILTVLLLNSFKNYHDSCKDSFFAYHSNNTIRNATTSKCHLTKTGEKVIISYFVFSGIGLLTLMITFIHSFLLPFLDTEVVCSLKTCLYCIILIIPIYLSALIFNIFSILYPKIFFKSDLVVTFHRKWMGYTEVDYTSIIILITQTAYLVEHGLELTVVSGVFLSNYNTHYARFYTIFAIICVMIRMIIFGIRFVELFFEYICDDCIGLCCRDVNLKYENLQGVYRSIGNRMTVC